MTSRVDLDKLSESIVDDIKLTVDRAKKAGVSPLAFTLKDYKKFGGSWDGRSMRPLGGFAQLVKLVSPADFTEPRKYSYHLRKHNSHINKLELEREKYESLYSSVTEAVTKAIGGIQPALAARTYKYTNKRVGFRRMNVALISDTHFGLDIDPAEAIGNKYNWYIAAARLATYIEQVASFKAEHRVDCDGLALLLGGDLGQGVIHWHTDFGTQALAHQTVGISSYLIQSVAYLRQHYKKIDIYFTTDNHMRSTYRHPNRSTCQKWDSFSIPIATALEARFLDCDDVKVHFSKDPITTFKLLGHKYGLTHGDTHINTGNVGKNVNVESIATQLLKLNSVQPDGNYSVFCMGHVHTPLRTALSQSGTEVIVNGTLSGTDSYAASLGFFRSMPSQTLWECTEDHPVGDWRIVHLGNPDMNQTLIKPYDSSLHLNLK